MKKLYSFLSIFILFIGCQHLGTETEQKTPSNSGSFSNWSNSLTLGQVKEMYQTSGEFMFNARQSSQSIGEFSWRDSIFAVYPNDPNEYPYTLDSGGTQVFWRHYNIFKNSWNRPYATPANLLTLIYYGYTDGAQVLQIINQSYYPEVPNPIFRYRRENRIFIISGGRLINIDPDEFGFLYYLGTIKKTNRPGVIIFGSGSFPRSLPEARYYLVETSTGEYKMFDESPR